MPEPGSKAIAAFHRKLGAWYEVYGRRELPWRNTADAYSIYISEIMLQQTQVETVRTRFYEPFLKRFPTFKALSRASQEEVLSAWQGLGYYSRARNLHNAAIQSNGIMPRDVESLMALPGIGRNTAHAVAAFAYRHPVPVMEANLKRVLSRIFAMRTPTEQEWWERAHQLFNNDEPFDYNQAMMDIGATICTKRAPKCGQCPANIICEGKSDPETYPAPKTKKQVPVRTKNIILYMDGQGRVQATPRTTRFLQGMYHFTELEAAPVKGARKIGEVEQSYSHFTLQATIYLKSIAQKGSNDFYTLTELHALPMSMAEKKILRILAPHVIDSAA